MPLFADSDLKRLSEFSFLDQTNSRRYRAIVQVFSLKHQALKSFLYPEEILKELQQSDYFKDYNQDMLEQDLKYLVLQKNLEYQQESKKVKTIQEFQRKRYRYRATAITIKIQRFLFELTQDISEDGGSLEITLFDKLYKSLEIFFEEELMEEKINQNWNDVFYYFKTVTQNAQDYLALLSSERIEEAIKSKSFLIYKQAFTEYLRNFVLKLQQVARRCQSLIENNLDGKIYELINKIISHRASIPRLNDKEFNPDEVRDELLRRWQTLTQWFCDSKISQSEWSLVCQETNSTIVRISKFIYQYSDQHVRGNSKNKDYLHLAKLFQDASSLDECHKLSAVFFGVSSPLHIYSPEGDFNFGESCWEGQPDAFEIRPRSRGYTIRDRSTPIQQRNDQKERQKKEEMIKKSNLDKEIEGLTSKKSFRISDLSCLTRHQRQSLLQWVAGAKKAPNNCFQINNNMIFELVAFPQNEYVLLQCEDGQLKMPNVKVRFHECH